MAIADSTRLVAVNDMLSASGNARTSDLSSARGDVLMADSLLDRVDREMQGVGWYFNRAYAVLYTPDPVTFFVNLPSDVFSVSSSDRWARHVQTGVTTTNTGIFGIVKRGSRIYNLADKTFLFTGGDISVDQISRLDFTDLPQSFVSYITARASRMLFRRLRGSDSQDLGQAEIHARWSLMQDEARIVKPNAFESPDVGQVRQRRGRLPRS